MKNTLSMETTPSAIHAGCSAVISERSLPSCASRSVHTKLAIDAKYVRIRTATRVLLDFGSANLHASAKGRVKDTVVRSV